MLINNSQKLAKIFECEKCNYTCRKKSDFDKHLSTRKHEKLMNVNNQLIEISPYYICSQCKKEYKSNVGLWKHKKKCSFDSNNDHHIVNSNLTQNSSEVIHLTNLVMKLMNTNEELVKNNTNLQQQTLDIQKQNQEMQKQNQEFQSKILDVCKSSTTTISNNNSHNKTFNMQVFLNEKCKDAMNIMDFVNSMTLQLSDLEDVGEVGYVEGISKIITRKLNEIDVYKRPIHCSDYKREVMYVRDDDIWEKENSNYDKLRKAIKYITKKNSDLLTPWREKHPQCMNTSHRLNDIYIRLIGQAMGGKGEFIENENKIIKKISKAVVIDKDC